MFLDHENDIALDSSRLISRQFAKIDSARPLFRNGQPCTPFPSALAQPLCGHHGNRLRFALKRPQPHHVSPSGAAVVAHAVEIDQQAARWVQTDHEVDALAR